MLNIKIICVGKIREKAIDELCNEYVKRLTKFVKVEIIEVADEKIKTNASESEEEQIKEIESNRIIEKIEKYPNSKVYLLDLSGKELDSVEFSKEIENTSTYISSTIIFVIGGSLGLSKQLLNKYNDKLCFSKMTFPHQLFRVILLEQLFRAFKILNGEIYHK